jgi:hypothetical protein
MLVYIPDEMICPVTKIKIIPSDSHQVDGIDAWEVAVFYADIHSSDNNLFIPIFEGQLEDCERYLFKLSQTNASILFP